MTAAFERRVAGDALQLAGLVRDHGPETLHRLMDLWGPDHTRAVCIALAAAVDQDRTPTELWGWLGRPGSGQAPTTVKTNRLFRSDPVTDELDKEAVDSRAVDLRTRKRREQRRAKASAAGSGGEADPAAGSAA